MEMKQRTFVGRYIKNSKVDAGNKELNYEINDILKKLKFHENKIGIEEVKLASAKFRKMPVEYFQLMYPFIESILSMPKAVQEKILKKACEELQMGDLYVDRVAVFKSGNYKLENVFDFSTTICSEIGKYSVKLITSMKDELSLEELKEIIEKLNDNNKDLIQRFEQVYKDWYENLTASDELYDVIKSQENRVLFKTKDFILRTINLIEAREEALYLKGKSELKDILEKEKRKTKFYRKWMDE